MIPLTKRILLPLFILVAACESANILGVATYDGNSHWLVMKSVFSALVDAGHQVTVITPYSIPERKNFTIIDMSKTLPLRTNSFPYDMLLKEYYNPLRTMHVLPHLSLGQCDKSHATRQVLELLKNRPKFDLVISEIFGADCDAVFAHLLDVPLISVITSTYLPWANSRVGNPENPSYVGNIFLPYAGRMSFKERIVNVMYDIYVSVMTWYYNTVTTDLNQKHFGKSIPKAEDIFRRTSLVFVNSHFTVDGPRPFVPNIVEIGGIHLPAVKPLPKDLAEFMDASKNGVIYFSLGSIVQASSLPNKTINAIKEAFAELEFNVLWKYEDETLDVPSNVLIKRWFPQRDILAHKNIKLVILHGGLMGVYETVDVGVPALGMPIFFDQPRNIKNLESKGVALRLDIDKITKIQLLKYIRKLTGDKRFKERAEKLSDKFHDRPIKPSDAVVYWTEYVLKYDGAYHLRSPAAELSWYQLLLLDIIAFFSFVAIVFLYSLLKIRRIFSNHFKSKSTKAKPIKNGVHFKIQ